MRSLLRIMIALSFPGIAIADGIPMKNGHFVGEKVFVLRLTSKQINDLEKRRKGKQPLYQERVALTQDQVNEIERHAKKRILRLEIFEGDWKDCSCHAYNIGSRIAKGTVEVPISYLLSDKQIAERFGDFESEAPRTEPSTR